jgi:hypothetical protein
MLYCVVYKKHVQHFKQTQHLHLQQWVGHRLDSETLWYVTLTLYSQTYQKTRILSINAVETSNLAIEVFFSEWRTTRHNNGKSHLVPSECMARLWYSCLTSLSPISSVLNFEGLFNIVWRFVKRSSATCDAVHSMHYSYCQSHSHTNAHTKIKNSK